MDNNSKITRIYALIILTNFFFLPFKLLANQPISQSANHSAILKSIYNKISKFSPYVITISGGPAWTSAGKTQTFYLQSDVQNTYAANNKTNTLGTGELFLGLQRTLREKFTGQLGLALAGSGMANLSGSVWQDADPNFNNFNYTYSVNQFRVALKGKLIAEKNPLTQLVQPYISGGVGVGFNHAYNYQATPTLFQAVVAPGFSANTTTAFTYTIGAGMQKSLNTNWQAGIGYEFADWGQSSLGAASGQTLNSGLSLNHLYTNQLQFSLSYVA
jgi:opacity protein-like surface antigen